MHKCNACFRVFSAVRARAAALAPARPAAAPAAALALVPAPARRSPARCRARDPARRLKNPKSQTRLFFMSQQTDSCVNLFAFHH